MKKILSLALVITLFLTLAVTVASCGKEEQGDYELKSAKIAGISINIDNDDMVLRLKGENEVEIVLKNKEIATALNLDTTKANIGTYIKTNDKLIVTIDKIPLTFDYHDDTLTYTIANLVEIVLEK